MYFNLAVMWQAMMCASLFFPSYDSPTIWSKIKMMSDLQSSISLNSCMKHGSNSRAHFMTRAHINLTQLTSLLSLCSHEANYKDYKETYNKILIIKANEMHYFSALFGKELYMFRTDLLSIIRSLNTVFTAIGICHTSYVDCLLAKSGSWSR